MEEQELEVEILRQIVRHLQTENEELKRIRQMDMADHLLHNPSGQIRTAHEGGSLTVIHDFGDWTTHVDINEGKAPVLYLSGLLPHEYRVRAEDLYPHRHLLFLNLHQRHRVRIFPLKKAFLTAYELVLHIVPLKIS